MAGFENPTQSLYTTVRELVENSLDSCEEARVLPTVDVTIQSELGRTCTVSVSDNGTGVPDENVPNAFGKVLYGNKYSSRQRRGTFGLGVTMAVLYGQISTGTPAVIHTKTAQNEGNEYSVYIDIESNSPIVKSSNPLKRKERGTTVHITLNGDLKRSRERVIEYLRLTGISTPHARITLSLDDTERYTFGGFTKKIPSLPVDSLPHPHAADLELIRRLAAKNPDLRLHEFLVGSFQQLGHKTAEKFLNFIRMDPRATIGSLDREALSYLGNSLRKYDKFGKPSATCLSPVGKESFFNAIRKEFNATVIGYSQRGPLEWDGFPYIVEGVLAISDAFEQSDIPHLFRFANRVPLLYDSTDDVFAKTLKRIPWARYKPPEISGVAIFTHFCSIRVPYSAAGKQSITSVSSITSEILSLYRELGRKLKVFSEGKKRALHSRRKLKEFSRLFNLLAKFSSEVAGVDNIPDTSRMINELFEVDSDV